eukprot:Opistho-1_new@48190
MMEPPSLRDDGRGACLSLFDVPLVCLPWVESAADKHILALLVTVAVGVLLAVRFCHVIFDVDAPSLEVGRIREFSIVTLNSSARIVSFNAGSEILYGRSAEMVIGRQANVLYDMDDYDAMEMAAADFDTARRTGSVERILKVRKRRSSSVSNSGAPSDSRSSSTSSRTGEVADARRYVFANVIITAHRGGQGGFTLVGWDISRHVEAEEALRQSEERFRLLVGSVKDYAIFMLDVDGNIVSWNAGAQNIKQYKADEIVGRNFRTFYPQCDIDSGKPEMELREAKRVGRFEDFGWRLRKDGTQFWANVVITAVHNAAGELCGFAKVTRDITDRKLLEAAIIEKEAAESADRAKSQFLAMISHEIRTPMYGIIGCAELLASTALTDEQAEYVNTITKCGDGLLRLINDVLELSRVNAQQIVIENVAIDVPTICKEVVSIVETQAASRGIELVLSIPRRLPCIVNDPARLRQVLVNFVGNAVKFGNRRVVVSATETADGKAIRVEVTDDGIGIAPEDQQKLFHMFSQVDSSSTRAFGGTGLGLAICKRFTELMGGRIGVISDVGKGSTFWIELALPLDRFFFPSEFYAAVSSSIAQTKESQRAAVGAPSEQPAPAAPAAEFVFNPVPLAGDNTPQGTPPVTPRSGRGMRSALKWTASSK